LERMALKNVIMSPQEFFMAMLQSRGYPGTTYCSLKCGYHNSPTVSCVCHRVLIVASFKSTFRLALSRHSDIDHDWNCYRSHRCLH
jgi:hypothetical protein